MPSKLKAEHLIGYLLPVAPVLVPVVVHFILVSLVFLSSWLPGTYIFSHLILISIGLWACHAKKDILPALVFAGVVLITILLDIIQLGLYFPFYQDQNGQGRNTAERTWQFSAGMCIMNLLFKPIAIALACIAVYIRAGGTIGGLGATDGSGDYSDLHGSNDQGTSAE